MIKKSFIFIFILVIIFLLFSPSVFAADPKLVSKINTAFQKIELWLIKLATPAAAVAICTGIFIKKFSFGDEERIRVGKKLVRTSLYSYIFLLLLDLILSTLQTLLSD